MESNLNYLVFKDEIGGGLVLWHPKGARIRNEIEDTWKKTHIDSDYQLIHTPHVGKADLWNTSGHLEFYEENMLIKCP